MTSKKCSKCGTVNHADAVACRRCSESLANALQLSDHRDIKVSDDPKYQFGGWFIVFGIFLLLNLATLGFALMRQIQALNEVLRLSRSGRGASTLSQVQSVLVFEAIATGVMLIFGLIVIKAFCQTKGAAPNLVVIFLMSRAGYHLIDYFVSQSLLDGMPSDIRFHMESLAMFLMVGSLVQIIIWWPYFRLSKRVRYSFNN